MPVSVPVEEHSRLTDVLFCLALGNLCFIRRWFDLEILQVRELDFYRSAPSDPGLLIATLIASSILALGFWLITQWVRRVDNLRLTAIARCGTLLVMLYALEILRRYWFSELGSIPWDVNGILIALEVIVAAGAAAAALGNPLIFNFARTGVVLAGFLIPVMLVDFFWVHPQSQSTVFQPQSGLPMLHARPGVGKNRAPRVVWLLFDEFDQRLAFDERPASLKLPELDQLRAESLVANRVLQQADFTIVAVPSLLSGRPFEGYRAINARTLLVLPPGSKQPLRWGDQPNLFQQARRLGANTSLTGWDLPYCRMIGNSLVHCFDQTGGRASFAVQWEMQASEKSVGENVAFEFWSQTQNLRDFFHPGSRAVSTDASDAFVQRKQLQQFLILRDHAYREISDPQMDFVFVHLPIPHPFAIYDRKLADFALNSHTSYLDNLALVDRTVGEVRRTLERVGLWESTILMVSSDHALRPRIWQDHYDWTPEIADLMKRGGSATVPFMLKLTGHHPAAVYEPSVSNITAAQLSMAALSGNVTTPQQAVDWLMRQSEQPAISAR